jgi:hypothetical protein
MQADCFLLELPSVKLVRSRHMTHLGAHHMGSSVCPPNRGRVGPPTVAGRTKLKRNSEYSVRWIGDAAMRALLLALSRTA